MLTVSDMARSAPFYRKMCGYLKLTCVNDTPELLYHVGGRTALGIQPAAPQYQGSDRFVQGRVGLHHACFRFYSRDAVCDFATFFNANLAPLGGKAVRGPQEDAWAPGYYSFLFEDPDGIRLEVNHVPAKGLLAMDKPQVGGVDYGQPAAKL